MESTEVSRKEMVRELKLMLSRMSIQAICVTALPEIGVRWREVSRAVRNARLPMTPANVAQIICKHIAKSLPADELSEIIATVRLMFVTTQNRTWYVLTLSEETFSEPVLETIKLLPRRIVSALKDGRTKLSRPEVQTFMLGNLLFISIQLMSGDKQGTVFYAATPPGQPVALVTSLGSRSLIRALVEGLGYSKCEDAQLHGQDITSLLRIHNRGCDGPADNLAGLPEYAPVPVVTSSGVDFTHREYIENYVDRMLGPEPPLLTDLTVKVVKPFFDRSILNKQIEMKIQIKSEDLAKTLKSWSLKGAITPKSVFFDTFHKLKSNNIVYQEYDSD